MADASGHNRTGTYRTGSPSARPARSATTPRRCSARGSPASATRTARPRGPTIFSLEAWVKTGLDQRRQDHRPRERADRLGHHLRPPDLHDQQRPVRVRHPIRWGPAGGQSSSPATTTTCSTTSSPPRVRAAWPCTSTACPSAPTRSDPRRRHRLLADRRRQPDGLAERCRVECAHRDVRRGRGVPDGAHAGPGRRALRHRRSPAAATAPTAAPAGCVPGVGAGRQPVCVLASRRGVDRTRR